MARMAVFWSLAILIYWGAHSLHAQLGLLSDKLGNALGSDENGAGGIIIPVLAIRFSWAFIIACVFFCGAIYALYRWTETPKTADLLIETEQELKKVTWPTWREVRDSSAVVILVVLVLLVFLATSDIVLARISDFLLFGRSLFGTQ